MESIARVLHSSYAYLLIFQIVLVASLSLVLIGMLIRRVKNAAIAEGVGERSVSPEATELKTTISGLQSELQSLRKQNSELEAATKAGSGALVSSAENQALSEKIKYLEAKLFEYEILQEEIGALSTLKIENERLKDMILRLQKGKKESAPDASVELTDSPQRTLDETSQLLGEIDSAVKSPSAQ